jgi:S1-C subfamily serine protease
MNALQETRSRRISTVLIVTAIVVSLLVGGLMGYAITYSTLSGRINELQNQLSTLPYQNATYFLDKNVSLSQLYNQVKESVLVIQGLQPQYDIFNRLAGYSGVQGSGFISNFTGQTVVITNYHVVQGAINITVTFTDGNTYATTMLGSDPYADLAVLSANAPQYEYEPLNITSSSTLKVGDPVIAVGTPLGLTGSMTSGIVSALGRTVSVSWSAYGIADCIQTTAPINPGNSGGPLLNYQGKVVGITSYTAITSQGVAAQGLGLAIPSTTILREIPSLITNHSYSNHPWLGVSGTDMTFEIAQAMNTDVTYGWLITQVTNGGPAASAGLRNGTTQVQIAGNLVTIGGDIIIAINNTRIRNGDDLSTYLEENTLPGQTVNVTVVRDNQTITLPVILGTRPAPSP